MKTEKGHGDPPAGMGKERREYREERSLERERACERRERERESGDEQERM